MALGAFQFIILTYNDLLGNNYRLGQMDKRSLDSLV